MLLGRTTRPGYAPELVLTGYGLATAVIGSTARATNVACISVTASSIETPEPSFRISTPKIFAQAIAPYSFAPARVTSNGSTWSE